MWQEVKYLTFFQIALANHLQVNFLGTLVLTI